jgi:cobalt/nickel transport protein
MLIPSDDVVSAGAGRTVDLEIVFTHPMEGGPVMEMGTPRRFGMIVAGERYDLAETLKPQKIDGKTAYTASVRLVRPGDHVFYVEPAPYWEPAEAKMIVHYTKVVVDFMGRETGWDEMV